MLELSRELRAFENAGPLVERLRKEGPFRSDGQLLARAREILDALPEAQQIEVINAHPRIGERPDKVKAQSAVAFREQGYDRDTTPPEVFLHLASLNEQYKTIKEFVFQEFDEKELTEFTTKLAMLKTRLEKACVRLTLDF